MQTSIESHRDSFFGEQRTRYSLHCIFYRRVTELKSESRCGDTTARKVGQVFNGVEVRQGRILRMRLNAKGD